MLSARAKSAVVAGPCLASRAMTIDSVHERPWEAHSARRRRISSPIAWVKSASEASKVLRDMARTAYRVNS